MNAFLYFETDLRVLTKFLKESLSTLCEELKTLSLYLIDLEVDGIITDRPKLLFETLQKT